jgi:hypothetical protein
MSPVGVWHLWVVDDRDGITTVGNIGNWALEITGVEKADFNRDAHTDVLWHHETEAANLLWYMEGTRLFASEYSDPVGLPNVEWKIVGTHDFNGDGRTDILWRHDTSGESVVWFMERGTLVSGTFTDPPALADVNWKVAGTADFNGDAKPDILWRHDVTAQNVVWFMNGSTLVSGTFTSPAVLTDANWKPVGTGHFTPGPANLDTQPDILQWNQVTGELVILPMDGITILGQQFTFPAGLADTRWRPVATGDYNRDGQADIVWRHQDSGQNVVWFMGGPAGHQMYGGVLTDPPVFADARWKIVGPR